MPSLLPVLHVALPLIYIGTFLLYVRLFFSEQEEPLKRYTRLSLRLALATHTVYLMLLSMQYHRCPLTTPAEGLLFAAWMLCIIHAVNEQLTKSPSLGIFTALPSTVGVAGAALLTHAPALATAKVHESTVIFHIACSLTAYVCFCVAAVPSVMYVVQHRRLKRKRFDVAFRKIPSLEQLDRLSAAWNTTGCIAFIASAVIGVLWVPRPETPLSRLTFIPLLLLLAIFLTASIGRRAGGWRGIRHAVLILIGFGVLVFESLLSFLKFHGFYS